MTAPDAIQHVLDAHTFWVQIHYEYWLQHAYSVVWWLLLSCWILPWVIWCFLVDRKKIIELTFYGVIVMFITTFLDATGTAQGLWFYPIKVIPFTPHLEPTDWGILPVIFMLVYQYFPTWKTFIIAQIIVATLFSFIGEPFLTKLGVYMPLHWENIYSLPVYLMLAVIPKATIELLYIIGRKTKTDCGENTDER